MDSSGLNSIRSEVCDELNLQSAIRLIAIVFALATTQLGSHAATPRFLVVHDPVATDQSGDNNDAIDDAKEVNGIVEFEAGKVYRTSQI